MPGVHREEDKRFNNSKTIVIGQSTVFVNNKLWAVEGDISTKCEEARLIPIYGQKNVYIEGKLVICAIGDAAVCCDPECPPEVVVPPKTDLELMTQCCPPEPSTWPRGKSDTVKVYHGARGGTATRVSQL